MLAKNVSLLIVGFCLTYNCYSQNILDTPINISWNQASLVKVQKDIERLTGLNIWYDPAVVNFTITLEIKNVTLRKVFDTIFHPRGCSWTPVDKLIAIAKLEYVLKGRVLNQKKEPVSFVSIAIKETSQSTFGDKDGIFSLKPLKQKFTLRITAIGYISLEKRINGDTSVIIILDTSITNLAQVSVQAAKNSKQTKTTPNILPPKDSLPPSVPNTKTGSVFTINNEQFNLAPTQNITDRFTMFTGMALPNPITTPGANQSPITMRSRITINGYPHILVMLNGIAYQGDINNINPNDVENITLVKDAAASTQLGIHSGNGVLIVTTKESSYNTPTKLTAIANFTTGLKPNFSNIRNISSANHIEIIKALFDSGYYDNQLANSPWYPFSPVVGILHRKKTGSITAAEAETALTSLRNTDFREEVRNNLYQISPHQQYQVGIQGGDNMYRFTFSQGFDVAKWNLVGNDNNRFTMYLNHALKTGKNGPEIFNIINCSQNIINNNGIEPNSFQNPYIKLADGQGNSLTVTKTLNQTYKDSINSTGKLLNWDFKPLEEIGLGNNKITNTAVHFTLGMKYHFLKKLDATITYRHETEISEQLNRHSEKTYYTRDIINQFSQIDSIGNVYRPIPLGAIIDRNLTKRTAGNLNLQVKFDAINTESHSLIFFPGYESRHIKLDNEKQLEYGVKGNGIKATIDHKTLFSSPYDPGITGQIPDPNDSIYTQEHYYAFFINSVYTWKKRLTASISYRKDESNIFGVQANLKGVPLFATGLSWVVKLKDNRLFSMLRLKLTNGYCSNASKSLSALTGLQTLGPNPWNAPFNVIVNPPNPRLGWEKVRISNIGVDFSMLKDRISGTAEFFVKEGNKLIGMAPIDPTSGVGIFQGNVAAMSGHGLEITLNTKFGGKNFQWQSNILTSYIRDEVTTYFIQQPSIWYYCDPRYINPIQGKPLFSMYSLRFHGLDPANGDPIGNINNAPTKNYNKILQSPELSDLVYHGPATPTFYGSFRNTFSWKKLELGFNIVWKAGYYFRNSSINYYNVMKGDAIGHSDFNQRWQRPGDEHTTYIPSLQLPVDYSRDLFFNYSSALVQKGDHIRLQDIRLKYYLNKNQQAKKRSSLTEFYIYANNIGLLWKANDKGIDPDYVNSLPQPVQITIGTKIEL